MGAGSEKYFTVEKAGQVTIVHLLFAELSLEDAEEVKSALYAHVTDTSNKFIIDLHQCVFMSSVALGVLVCLTAKIHHCHGRIALASPTKEVAVVLEITKLAKIYDVYDSREKALASFA